MDMHMMLLVGALLAAWALSMYNPILGAIAGIVVTLGVGVWGWTSISQGNVIAFLGKPLSREAFVAFVGAITCFNVVQLVRALRARRGRVPRAG